MITIQQATSNQIDELMELFEIGRLHQVATGNPNQWPKGYPGRESLAEELKTGHFYIGLREREIVLAFYLMPSPDPTYTYIEGPGWLNQEPYRAIHRFGVKYPHQGLGRLAMDWIRDHYSQLRIDTHEDNHAMQKLIASTGFQYCGIIYLANGDKRLAYHYVREEKSHS